MPFGPDLLTWSSETGLCSLWSGWFSLWRYAGDLCPRKQTCVGTWARSLGWMLLAALVDFPCGPSRGLGCSWQQHWCLKLCSRRRRCLRVRWSEVAGVLYILHSILPLPPVQQVSQLSSGSSLPPLEGNSSRFFLVVWQERYLLFFKFLAIRQILFDYPLFARHFASLLIIFPPICESNVFTEQQQKGQYWKE